MANGNSGLRNIPSSREMAQMSAVTAGKDVARYPLYSILDMPAAGVTSMAFFSTAQGGTQTVGATNITMSRDRTNLQKANALATPNDFILKSLRLMCFPRYTESTAFTIDFLKDLYLVLTGGHCRIVVGQKEFANIAPLMAISAGCGLEGQISTSQTTVDRIYFANQHPLIYKVEPWLVIPSELNFKIELNWDVAPNISSAMKIAFWLDGDIVRPVQ